VKLDRAHVSSGSASCFQQRRDECVGIEWT
jgi:hypothetical protein